MKASDRPPDAPDAIPVTDQGTPQVTAPAREADPREVARFLREQPPGEVPRRRYTPTVPGLVARSVLGARVVRRFD